MHDHHSLAHVAAAGGVATAYVSATGFTPSSDVEVYDEAGAVAVRPLFPDSNAYERQIEAFARYLMLTKRVASMARLTVS